MAYPSTQNKEKFVSNYYLHAGLTTGLSESNINGLGVRLEGLALYIGIMVLVVVLALYGDFLVVYLFRIGT